MRITHKFYYCAETGIERLFEGDLVLNTECFQELLNIKTENAIGRVGMERLAPWLGNKGKAEEYTIILTDPRPQSIELRETCQSLVVSAALPADMLKRLLVVNADSPAENRRWMKKSPAIAESSVEILSDEKMQFMRAFTALGEKRWSLTMFIIANGRIQKLARQVDRYSCAKTIQNAVNSLDELRL